MTNTATRAIKEMNTRAIAFKNKEHEKFYMEPFWNLTLNAVTAGQILMEKLVGVF